MILDMLANASRYQTLIPGFAAAFVFLARPDLKDLATGKYGIDGENVYATVSKAPGRKPENARLETHERYIDIHLILAGTDLIGWKPASLCATPAGEYDGTADVRFFADEPVVRLATAPGMFAIFFPEDAHMPGVSAGQIHKVIVKVVTVPEKK
ncbi:MAG: YhcH/YjgK/YiaL family protein [Thermodesulfobacteriota bacterium]